MPFISWNPSDNRHLTSADVERILTPEHVRWLEHQPAPHLTAQCRAAGAWQANDREHFAAYTRFAELHAA